MTTLRIGTRGSKLALWQANWVASELCKFQPDLATQIVAIQTMGEKEPDFLLTGVESKGFFTGEIEAALLEGSIDVAVHSLKDLPTQLPEGLEIGAYCKREYARDVLITKSGKTFANLPAHTRIGTSSLRRMAQIRNLRPDIECVDIRGNIDTRLKKLEESGKYDGIVIAAAGIIRIGRQDAITEYLAEEICLPAPGQGVIAVEISSERADIRNLVTPINHQPTEYEARAERQFLYALEGGCQVPIGARARYSAGALDDGTLELSGMVASLDGSKVVRVREAGAAPVASSTDYLPAVLLTVPELLGNQAAANALSKGARKILEEIRRAGGRAE